MKVGEKWVSKDRRDRGKVVQVTDTWASFGGGGLRGIVEVVFHPHNPKLVGRSVVMKASTLHAKYIPVKQAPAGEAYVEPTPPPYIKPETVVANDVTTSQLVNEVAAPHASLGL